MLIAAFMGYGPDSCSRITVTGVEERNQDLLVTVVEERAGPHSACFQAITTPYHIVALDRSDKNVVFVHRSEPVP